MRTLFRRFAVALLVVGAVGLVGPPAPARTRPGGGPARPLHTQLAPNLIEDRKTPAGFGSASSTWSEPASRAPVIADGFDGLANRKPIVSPSDAAGAIGPTSIVAAVNVRIGVFDRSGTSLITPIRLKKLDDTVPSFGASVPRNAEDTDPKVLYDPYDDMFVAVSLAYTLWGGSWMIVTTIPSASADDTGTWCAFVLKGDQTAGDGRQFADYPGIGLTADRVTITTNNFNDSLTRYDHAQILSLRKSQLYDPSCNGPVRVTTFAGARTRAPGGAKAFAIQPALTDGGSSPRTQYLVSFRNAPRRDKITLWRLKKAGGRLRLAKTDLGVGNTKIPYYGLQRGGSTSKTTTWWDTGDQRLVNAFYDADLGRLYTAHAVRHNFAPSGFVESAIRWYEIDPAGSLDGSRVLRKGFVGESGADAAWPSVATDENGVLYVNYSQASLPNGEYLSAWAATIQPGGTAFATQLLAAGEDRYEFSLSGAGIERWGDYSQINRDPTDGSTMALFNAYVVNDGGLCGFGGSRSCLWQQWIALVGDA